MMKPILFLTVFVCVLSLSAQKIQRVSGEYKTKIESNVSENQAIREATQQARINALQNTFGTRVGMMNQMMMENANGKTNTSFSSISNSLVKGVWLKDVEEPKVEFFYDGDDRWVKVSVEGRARGLDNSGLKFQVKPLKCENINCYSQEFSQNEGMILYFRSPESGYLSVFLDDKTTAAMILPYKSMNVGSVPIEADKEYFLFKSADKYNYFKQDVTAIDEYFLYTPFEYEVDLLYVFFSREPFSKPILDDNGPDYPKSTTSKKFNDWVAEIMSYENMYMEVIDISIKK